jgi:hypothetical protein
MRASLWSVIHVPMVKRRRRVALASHCTSSTVIDANTQSLPDRQHGVGSVTCAQPRRLDRYVRCAKPWHPLRTRPSAAATLANPSDAPKHIGLAADHTSDIVALIGLESAARLPAPNPAYGSRHGNRPDPKISRTRTSASAPLAQANGGGRIGAPNPTPWRIR